MSKTKIEDGNVILEFIGITVALLVPISIIANSSIMVANAYLSTDLSARTAARAFVVSSSDVSGTRAAISSSKLTAHDFDPSNNSIETTISCNKTPCLSPGGFVTVRVSKEVRLNLPKALGSRNLVVTSQHTAVVDELRSP